MMVARTVVAKVVSKPWRPIFPKIATRAADAALNKDNPIQPRFTPLHKKDCEARAMPFCLVSDLVFLHISYLFILNLGFGKINYPFYIRGS